jgi:hypothetical protein
VVGIADSSHSKFMIICLSNGASSLYYRNEWNTKYNIEVIFTERCKDMTKGVGTTVSVCFVTGNKGMAAAHADYFLSTTAFRSERGGSLRTYSVTPMSRRAGLQSIMSPKISSSTKALAAILPLIEASQPYEAHQKARTFASRYVKTGQYDTAVDVLFQSARELLKVGQTGSGVDLASFLIDVYESKKEVVEEESRSR